MRGSGVWDNQTGDICLEAAAKILKFSIIVYTSLKQLPMIAFAPDNLYKNDSSQHGSILFLAYNSCPGHEHFSTVQDVTSTENLITLGEDEDRQIETADGSKTVTDNQFA